MPTTRTKAKPRGRNRRGKAQQPTACLKRPQRKVKAPVSAAYDAKKFAGSVPAFAGITPEEMSSWRDDR